MIRTARAVWRGSGRDGNGDLSGHHRASITLEGDANGAPHPDESSYAKNSRANMRTGNACSCRCSCTRQVFVRPTLGLEQALLRTLFSSLFLGPTAAGVTYGVDGLCHARIISFAGPSPRKGT